MKQIIIRLPDDQAAATPIQKAAQTYGITSFIAKGYPNTKSLTLYSENSFTKVTLRTQDDIIGIAELVDGKAVGGQPAKKADMNVLIQTTDWRVIPLENLISMVQGKGVHIYAEARDRADAIMLSGVMEEGVEGVIITPKSVDDLLDYVEAMGIGKYKINLLVGKIDSVEMVGLGERSCVDTANMLHEGEGMLLGSFSSFFFLVHAEVATTGFTNPRPFRVNAGGIHNYIMLPDGRTKYLSEIGAGDHVLVVSSSGEGRRAIVGRSKIERRPLIMIKASVKQPAISGSIMLQYAETISLLDEHGRPVSVTSLKAGDQIMVHAAGGPKGRHFGVAIDETIIEK